MDEWLEGGREERNGQRMVDRVGKDEKGMSWPNLGVSKVAL